MSTNVKPRDLNYDGYSNEKYDDDIVRSIPGHVEMHDKISSVIKERFSGKKIVALELGIGTGLTALKILRIVPDARYVGIDFSETMMAGAVNRLKGFDTDFIKGDFSDIGFPESNDLVISVIGMHHQKMDNDKKKLFAKIFDSLKENGVFIFGDLMTFKNPEIAALNEARHFNYLVENAKDEKSLKEWAFHHKFQNCLAPMEDQIAWLKEVGFKEVDVVFTLFNTVLIMAVK